MTEKHFVEKIRQLVADYTNEHLDKTDGVQIAPENVFVVWSCKTLQNYKALVSMDTLGVYGHELRGEAEDTAKSVEKLFENILQKGTQILAHFDRNCDTIKGTI